MTATDLARKPVAAESMAENFVRRAAERDLTIGVVGLGYVGLPLAEALFRQGFRIIGFDVDEQKLRAIEAGQTYIKHISDERVRTLRDSKLTKVTSDPQRLREADALLMCVPTPLNQYREPDLSYVESTTRTLGAILRRGQLVVLESTTYPGTSDEIVRPVLEAASGLTAGVDFAIAYSPEREDPGNIDFSTATIPKVIGANSDQEYEMAKALYGAITQTVKVRDLRTAEAVKLMENIFRLVNIALVNELKVVFEGLDIDIWEVIDAAKTKPFGFMPFYPGPGLGGHCIPIDPFYLTWKARAHGETTRFIELAGDVVTRMPRHVIERLSEAMSTRLQKAVSGSKVLVVGLAYKKNVDDMRESPSLHLIHLLRERGAEVDYYDPHIPEVPATRDHPEFAGMKSITWSPTTLNGYDCALISTDHDAVDYEALAKFIPLVVDTRNAAAQIQGELSKRIVKA